MLFQLKLQSKIGTSKSLPIKKRRPDLKITLIKCANEPHGARFRALFANWDALLFTHSHCFNVYLSAREKRYIDYFFYFSKASHSQGVSICVYCSSMSIVLLVGSLFWEFRFVGREPGNCLLQKPLSVIQETFACPLLKSLSVVPKICLST